MKYFLFIILFLQLSSCRKFVEVDNAPGRRLFEDVYSNDSSANSAVAGIYTALRSIYYRSSSPAVISGLSGDELYTHVQDPYYQEFRNNDLQPTNSYLPWPLFYNVIYQSNAAEIGLLESETLNNEFRNHLLGEIKFIRAFCYFNLVNFFGDVPLLLSIDTKITSVAKRDSVAKVYRQIVNDLMESASLLKENDNYVAYRINKFSARSLLARVYLFNQNWALAEQESSFVIDSKRYHLLRDIDSFSIAGNSEAIFQFSEKGTIQNIEAGAFIFVNSPIVFCSESLLSDFEPGDLRRRMWIDSAYYAGKYYYYPFKYKRLNSDDKNVYSVLRLAEQYLIRSEARAHQNKVSLALEDLNSIRSRSELSPIEASLTVDSCVSLVIKERRAELFAENGHRWMDLKRVGWIDQILLKEKGNLWKPTDALYPIPSIDIERNPNLVQNPD